MKTILSKNFLSRLGVLLLLLSISLFISGCSGDDSDEPSGSLAISGVQLPTSIDAAAGEAVMITGKGFVTGDQITFESSTVGSVKYTSTVSATTATSARFAVPVDLSSGRYKLYVSRGSNVRLLGTTTINIRSNLPDKTGMNVKGLVSCAGKPLAGVVVSDGTVVTKTDANGVYYINSNKKNGYVFISVPGGYEVPVVETTPQFFKYLSQAPATVEQKDFTLTARNNDKHKVFIFTDVHLANRVSDLKQFRAGFLAETKNFVRNTETQGLPVYGISLGDLSWDTYWYDNNYNLKNYHEDTREFGCAVFNTPGNHDHDVKVSGNDFRAMAPFREFIGPNYYSFNLGKVHYIMIDNVEYTNPSSASGTYSSKIVTDIMSWLKLDLATVDKSTPIVLGMHVPLHAIPTLSGGQSTMKYSGMSSGAELVKCLEGYTNVNVVSGHTHVNFNVMRPEGIREHNIAAVCATWWWTGHTNYANNHISRDGTPGGYKIFEMDGGAVKWRFKSIGETDNYQFRTYDLNKCLVNSAKYCPGVAAADVKTYAGGYDTPNSANEVLINVFDWANDWSIEVKDLSTNETLTTTRVNQKDPLHIISYNMKKLLNKSSLTFATSNTAHLFKAKAKSASSKVQVTVTDSFGNVYTETMTRPKELMFNSK